jgi:hypothetical protein
MKENNIKRILKIAYNEVDFEDFDFTDYNYIVKATDTFLSGWGTAKDTKAKTILFCKDTLQVHNAIYKMKKDGFTYCNWYNIKHERPQFKSGNVFTIRIIDNCILWK